MNRRLIKALSLWALAGLLPAWSQSDIVFKPHDPAAPAATVSGSIRGAEGDLSVSVLAPGQLAATAQASPVLYWFSSGEINDPVELVIVPEGGVEPLVELILEPPIAAGIQEFVLPDGVQLETGAFYQWSVSVIPDPDNRSNDVFSSALMQRVASPDSDATGLEAARAHAGNGLWYDALAALRNEGGGADADLLWQQLMDQAGLSQINEFQRRNSP